MKRLMDIVVGGLLALLAIPTIVVCAVVLTITLRAFPFFVQRRVGRDGREFRLVKLRTLPAGTPPYVDKYRLAKVDIPPFARLLRRLHLDELPQLFLVPLGRMSLVGPRPEMPSLHRRLPASFASLRTSVRPGCTGLWQIGRHSDGLIGETPFYDEFYLSHRSAALDVWILAQTVRLMVGRGRLFRLVDIPEELRGPARISVHPSTTAPAMTSRQSA